MGIIVSKYERNFIARVDENVKELYDEVNEFFGFKKPSHPDLLAIHEVILKKTVKGYGKFFNSTSMSKSTYYEEPSYYGWSNAGFRGVKFSRDNNDGTYDHSKYNNFRNTETAQKLNEFYFETLDMFSYFAVEDYKNYFLNIADFNEEVTLLRVVSENETVEWGDETLMSAEDWEKIQEDFDNGDNLGLWNEVQSYETHAVFNILEEIADEMSWWDGEEGILSSIENILGFEKTKVQALLMIKELTDIMESSVSYNRKQEQMQRLMTKYEDLCEEIEYAW